MWHVPCVPTDVMDPTGKSCATNTACEAPRAISRWGERSDGAAPAVGCGKAGSDMHGASRRRQRILGCARLQPCAPAARGCIARWCTWRHDGRRGGIAAGRHGPGARGAKGRGASECLPRFCHGRCCRALRGHACAVSDAARVAAPGSGGAQRQGARFTAATSGRCRGRRGRRSHSPACPCCGVASRQGQARQGQRRGKICPRQGWKRQNLEGPWRGSRNVCFWHGHRCARPRPRQEREGRERG